MTSDVWLDFVTASHAIRPLPDFVAHPGRRIYARRQSIVEPIFANLRSNKGLDHFTYRGQLKVNIQWLPYCLVHNLEKIAHYGKTYGRKRPCRALFRLSPWLRGGLRIASGALFSNWIPFRSPNYSLIT